MLATFLFHLYRYSLVGQRMVRQPENRVREDEEEAAKEWVGSQEYKQEG